MRFRDALSRPGLGAIAEVKRRSPSAGDLRPDADPARLAAEFERAGASACSILVDERFAGSWDDLRAARAASKLPLLAKGFFSSTDDLRTAKEADADAVLLLLRDLDDEAAAQLQAFARDLGLDALVEAHDAEELDRAVRLGAEVIGVNARNLDTFAIDTTTQLDLIAAAPGDRVLVAESAVHTTADGAAAELAGADALLIGTALMKAQDPTGRLREIMRRPLVKVCGLTQQSDVDAAVEAGADLLGFILAAESPRRATEVLDVPDDTLRVAVFVGEVHETSADLVQYYERENGHRARDGVLLRNGERVATVVDLPWLETDTTHLERARATPGRVMLAGGLGPENVREAIDAVAPWAVDSARSTEREPGIKDHDKVEAWVAAAKSDPGVPGAPLATRGRRAQYE
jgi:indole-3-glycerol phosphate synthase/phosphoribosylanthranilate isomerase